MRIAVISDTHLRGPAPALPAACRALLAAADLIVHAGDHSDMAALGLVRGIGPPVLAVHGNIEDRAVRAELPATAAADLGDLRIGVVHDGGPERGRLRRLRALFPDAGIVVFGHSHVPLLGRAGDGFTILNPGSPTERRRAARHSMAEIVVRDGAPAEIAFWAVDDPPGPLAPGLIRPS
jgi:putative phosphoesterase